MRDARAVVGRRARCGRTCVGTAPGAVSQSIAGAACRMHRPPNRRAARGVSLLEMLLVVALIAATSVLAAAALGGGFAGLQLRSSSKDIAAQLRFTRTHAIATGEPQRFVIDPAAHRWTAPEGRAGDIPEALGIRFFGARQVQPSRGEGAIVFFPDGASTGGRVQLHRDGAGWNVDVAWLTGRVTLQRAQERP
jgi:general secretion pathway protein H